eukprot:scaffold101039_cov21-Tisochrysis_lutea.AAC.1
MKKKPKKGAKPDAKPQIKTEKVGEGCHSMPVWCVCMCVWVAAMRLQCAQHTHAGSGDPITQTGSLVDSFFNFFSPPDVPAEDDEMEEEQMEELQALIEADYEVSGRAQVGATIKEKLIPHAVHWYTGEAIDEDPFGEMGGQVYESLPRCSLGAGDLMRRAEVDE